MAKLVSFHFFSLSLSLLRKGDWRCSDTAHPETLRCGEPDVLTAVKTAIITVISGVCLCLTYTSHLPIRPIRLFTHPAYFPLTPGQAHTGCRQ